MRQISPPAHAPSGALSPAANVILAGLAAVDLHLLEPMEHVRLSARCKLYDADDPLRHVYFPTVGVVSLAQFDGRGAMLETAHIGAEGMIGMTGLLGAERARERAVMHVGGEAYRVRLSSARTAFAQSKTFQALALKFAELQMLQLSQNVICKVSHTVEQQFCQRLLLYTDRVPGASLEMTHEQFAEALGSRRQGITEAARKLQASLVIAYSRGRIRVIDRAALERHACECYRILRDAYRGGAPQMALLAFK